MPELHSTPIFLIQIELLPSGKLGISGALLARNSEPSSAGAFDNPFTLDEVARIVGILDGSVEVSRAERTRATRTFGEKLFALCFPDPILRAYQEAKGADSTLAIGLDLDKAGDIAEWPWELLHTPRADYIALNRTTAVERMVDTYTSRRLIEARLPLSVAVLVASPNDQPKLDAEREYRLLLDATKDARARGLLELDRAENGTIGALQALLRGTKNYQIVHFIGYSQFRDDQADQQASGDMALILEDPNRRTVPLAAETLARELENEPSVRLIVLNNAQRPRSEVNSSYTRFGATLVSMGIPAVLSLQAPISDDAMRAAMTEFYRAIAEGQTIQVAVTEARRAVNSALGSSEWASLVLHAAPNSSFLFPKRRSSSGRASPGGLRERIAPIAVLTALGVALLLAAFVVFNRADTFSPIATATPVVVRDVDLLVTNIRFLPADPDPGQRVTVSITIKNQGTTDTGRFKWAWFASADALAAEAPTLEDTQENLSANSASLTVKGDYVFGGWGTFLTTAFVNFDNDPRETSQFNNRREKSVTVSDDPMVIDFTLRPTGDPIVETVSLKDILAGNFRWWGLEINADTSIDPACSTAVAQITVIDDLNRLSTGKEDDPNACRNLPIAISFIEPTLIGNNQAQVGTISVTFTPSTAGSYNLELLDSANVAVGSAEVNVTRVDASNGTPTTISVSRTGGGSLQGLRAIFTPPQETDAITTINLITLERLF